MDFNELVKMNDRTAEFSPTDIENNKTMGILAYIGILVLVPIFGAPQSKFARFHASQGVTLAIIAIVLGVVEGIMAFIPVIGTIVGIILGIPCLAIFALAIIGIINAAQGKAVELPIVSKIKFIK